MEIERRDTWDKVNKLTVGSVGELTFWLDNIDRCNTTKLDQTDSESEIIPASQHGMNSS